MKKISVLFITLISFLFVVSCGPQIMKRYHQITVTPIQEGCQLVRVSTFTMNVPGTSRKSSLMQLSGQGQAAFIDAISKKAKDTTTMLRLLGSTISSSLSSSTIIDHSKFDKRVVFSVEKQAYEKATKIGPADRIDRLGIKLSGLTGAKFLSWNKFETTYDTVDLGELSDTISADSSLTVLDDVYEMVTPSVSKDLTEDVSLTKRYVVLGGHLADHSVHLYQQGTVGIDLAGNFNVDFVIQAEVEKDKLQTTVSFQNLFKASVAAGAAKVGISFQKIKYPKSSEPVTCKLDFYYHLRHVEKKENTLSEADDTVTMIRCHDDHGDKIQLISKEDLQVKVFYIAQHKDDKNNTSPNAYLFLKGPAREPVPICLTSHDTANEFLRWLKISKSTSVGGYEILLGCVANKSNILKEDEISSLYVSEKSLN